MQKRRKYSEEFKREAVSFANQAGVTAKQVGEELGINANMIGRWRRELGMLGPKAFTGQGKPRDEEMVTLVVDARRRNTLACVMLAFL